MEVSWSESIGDLEFIENPEKSTLVVFRKQAAFS
jgi:hypothetical protein